MGDDVTIFFTFWGLNLLRKREKVKVSGKSFLQSMFGKMMPRGHDRVGLSKMNFAGMGAPLMKKVMKQQNVMSLDELITSAREQGVKFVACTMSMDVLGLQEGRAARRHGVRGRGYLSGHSRRGQRQPVHLAAAGWYSQHRLTAAGPNRNLDSHDMVATNASG